MHTHTCTHTHTHTNTHTHTHIHTHTHTHAFCLMWVCVHRCNCHDWMHMSHQICYENKSIHIFSTVKWWDLNCLPSACSPVDHLLLGHLPLAVHFLDWLWTVASSLFSHSLFFFFLFARLTPSCLPPQTCPWTVCPQTVVSELFAPRLLSLDCLFPDCCPWTVCHQNVCFQTAHPDTAQRLLSPDCRQIVAPVLCAPTLTQNCYPWNVHLQTVADCVKMLYQLIRFALNVTQPLHICIHCVVGVSNRVRSRKKVAKCWWTHWAGGGSLSCHSTRWPMLVLHHQPNDASCTHRLTFRERLWVIARLHAWVCVCVCAGVGRFRSFVCVCVCVCVHLGMCYCIMCVILHSILIGIVSPVVLNCIKFISV